MPTPIATTCYDASTATYHWSDGHATGSAATLAEAKICAIYRYAHRVVHYQCHGYRYEDVEDAFQEALIQLWRLLDSPDHPLHATAQSASTPWLARRAALLSRSYLYRLKQTASLDALQEARGQGLGASDPTVAQALDAHQQQESASFVDALLAEVNLWLPEQVGYLTQVVQWMVEGSTMTDAAQRSGHHITVVSRQLRKYLTPILRRLLDNESPYDLLDGDDEPVTAAEGMVIQLSFALAFDLAA